ncbi:MAG: N-acetyltransferase, partial [bacterium]|nr:N-acetyltransferase [bacterium]
YLAEDNGLVLGTYILKANQIGLGAHIANASFMVSPDHHGKGIGRAMAQHCLIQAKESGYNAMQFNIVISTNTSAINLWQSLGFQIIGTTPKAFNHQTLGLIDSHIMFKAL